MLRQRASKKILAFITLFIVSNIVFLPDVYAQDTTVEIADKAFIINSDWLSVSVSEFDGEELDYNGKFDRLNIDIGSYGMTNFVNHGEIAEDSETDTHIYMCEMNFPYWVVLFTDCMIDDVYPNHYTGTTNREWLKLKTFQHWLGGFYQGDVDYNEYDVSYRSIRMGTIDTHEYDGNLRLNAIVQPDLPIEEGGTITINGVVFNVPDIRVFIESVDLEERVYGTCDDPQNYYTYNDGVIEVRKEDLENYDFSHGSSDAKSECGDGLSSNSLVPYAGKTTARDEISWAGVHDIRRTYGVTYTTGQVGQAFASAPTVGSTWDRLDDLNDYDEVFEFDSHTRIKPNIFYDKEDFEVRHTYLYVDRYYAWNSLEYGLCDIKEEYVESRDRVIGLGVQNIFIKMKYNFKVTMLLAVQARSEEGEEMLEDPEVYQGDIVWDNAIGGTTDAKASTAGPSTPADDAFGSFSDLITDTGKWVDDQVNWMKDQWEEMADQVLDWWDNLPTMFSDLFEKYWWIILLAIAVVVVIVLIYISIQRRPVRTYKRYAEPNVRQPNYNTSNP